MGRDIDLEPNSKCDICGKRGAFDFMGDYACPQCLGHIPPKDKSIIDDGFGNAWSMWCPECGKKSMSIVRPGKVQCGNCG
jgi:ssDNA-binding Zn-finger/Zn-ribbon topoisomerase 1